MHQNGLRGPKNLQQNVTKMHQMVHFGSDSTLTDRFRIFFCKTRKNYFCVQLKILQSNLPEEQLEIQR